MNVVASPFELTARTPRNAYFFDGDIVKSLVTESERVAMMKAGALVRTIARRSLRVGRRLKYDELTKEQKRRWNKANGWCLHRGLKPRKIWYRKSGSPGDPPKISYSKSPLRQLLDFAFDPSNRAVVVGPRTFPRSSNKAIPQLLEFGGSGVEELPSGPQHFTMRPRPFMAPALKLAQPRIAQFFEKT
jgi:hypothetical protein